jgi:hypothetical protein
MTAKEEKRLKVFEVGLRTDISYESLKEKTTTE